MPIRQCTLLSGQQAQTVAALLILLGTTNLLGISHSSPPLHPEKKRNLGYGYRSSEQAMGASLAVEEARHYVTGYLDPY